MVARPIRTIQRLVLRWYGRYGRDLPWRKTRDPYSILVSEVMLQQTQVSRVRPKYLDWLTRWPTAQSLATAAPREVLQAWSGLGYNSRALRLQQTARMVTQELDGQWPQTVDGLKELPGIGPYTAGAVSVFAWRQPVSMIDTNIRRVLGRVFFGPNGAKSDRQLAPVAVQAVPLQQPDVWHHALMDIGATICLPQPRCEECPLRTVCRAYPRILTVPRPLRRKKSVTFRDSDRYWRGSIIRILLSTDGLATRQLHQRLRDVGQLQASRRQRILLAMKKDGLVLQKNGRWQIIESVAK